MAILQFDNDGYPVVQDVEGYLTPKDIIIRLEKIKGMVEG